MPQNEYVSFPSEIKEVIQHTQIEYTFRMAYEGKIKPGQFFEVSMPKYGEAPISVSGMGDGTIDLTIRKVGLVTDEVFERYVGERLFLRGPYGNGFDLNDFKEKEIVIISGGTGLSPVKGGHAASKRNAPAGDRRAWYQPDTSGKRISGVRNP